MRAWFPLIYGAYISNLACATGSSGGYAYSSWFCLWVACSNLGPRLVLRPPTIPRAKVGGGLKTNSSISISQGARPFGSPPGAVYIPYGTHAKPLRNHEVHPKPGLSAEDMGPWRFIIDWVVSKYDYDDWGD